MRALCDMDTIQIEVTNACINSCSNCTRFCGHMTPYFMPFDMFKQAVDSLRDYPKMIGFMGGEPLLHPKFKEMCEYALSVIPKERLGLWTCLPKGKEGYSDLLCQTFEHIFINDHSRSDIYHTPVLVAADEVFKNKKEMFYAIEHCWLQNSWSAAVNPNGAFFCEIAASMSLLFDVKGLGWKVEPGWWWRTTKDFREQIEEFCPRCGCAVPLPRRLSVDGRDDISPLNLERLKGQSKKIDAGRYVISDLKMVSQPEQMAAYKDTKWRNRVASRYGIHLTINEKCFWKPNKLKHPVVVPDIYGALKENYNAFKERSIETCIQQ